MFKALCLIAVFIANHAAFGAGNCEKALEGYAAKLLAKSVLISDRSAVPGNPSSASHTGIKRYLMTNQISLSDLPYAVGWHTKQELPRNYSEYSIPEAPVEEVTNVILVSSVNSGTNSVVRLGKLKGDVPVALLTSRFAKGPGFLGRAKSIDLYSRLGLGPRLHGMYIDSDGNPNIVMDIVPGGFSE